MKNLKYFLSIIFAIFFSFVLSGCNNSNTPPDNSDNSHNDFTYTCSTLIHDITTILNFYPASDISLISLENQSSMPPEKKQYNVSNENCLLYLKDSLEFWQVCETYYPLGLTSYNKSDTITYYWKKTTNGFYFEKKYSPLNSINKYYWIYNMQFYNQTFCLEYYQNAGYNNDKHYFIEIKSLDSGLFLQYYEIQYYSPPLNNTICNIMKYFYSEDNETLYFLSNATQKDNSTSITYDNNIQISDISNLTLPIFYFKIQK